MVLKLAKSTIGVLLCVVLKLAKSTIGVLLCVVLKLAECYNWSIAVCGAETSRVLQLECCFVWC